MPSTTSWTSSGRSSGPFLLGYDVLFEKWTVMTGHTSKPSRMSGKVAALLPT